jgi:hypothetical protein
MQIDAKEGDAAVKGYRTRFWMYWISSVVATLIFLFFMTAIMLVPGVLPIEKVLMLSIAGIAIAVSLGVGAWKPITTDAPLAAQPLGPVMGVILFIELTMCIISIFEILAKGHGLRD